MMMNDFDDEQTMEEEEANEDQENEEDELAALEQEQDMPIEELLKMYGAVPATQDSAKSEPETKDDTEPSPSDGDQSAEPLASVSKSAVNDRSLSATTAPSASEQSAESEENGSEAMSSKRRGSDSPTPPIKKSKSELARFYEAAVEGRALRSQGGGQPEEADEEEEEEGAEGDEENAENRDYSWKKTIMIGPSYQAYVPSDLDEYGDTLPYENEDKLLWNPGEIATEKVEEYLSKSQEAVQTGSVGSLPLGAHVKDDEQVNI